MITYFDMHRMRNCPACYTLIPDILAPPGEDDATPMYDQMVKEGFKR